MTVSDVIYPDLPGLAWPITKTPQMKTLTQISANGKERSAALWTYPKWSFKLSYDYLRDDETRNSVFKTIVGFFLQRYGSHDDFLFLDKSDCLATDQLIGVGNGTAKSYQLIRSIGGFSEPVYGVDLRESYSFMSPAFAVKDRPTIFFNGVLQETGYILSSDGRLLFATAPSSGVVITATFLFYYRVRFKNDSMDFQQFAHQLWSANTVEFVSQK